LWGREIISQRGRGLVKGEKKHCIHARMCMCRRAKFFVIFEVFLGKKERAEMWLRKGGRGCNGGEELAYLSLSSSGRKSKNKQNHTTACAGKKGGKKGNHGVVTHGRTLQKKCLKDLQKGRKLVQKIQKRKKRTRT